MPVIGGVYIPDEQMPRIDVPTPARPGFGAILGASTEGTLRQMAAALPYQFDTLTQREVSAESEARYQQGLRESAAAFARAAPASMDDMTSGRVGLGRWVGENFIASVPQSAAILGGGLVGGLAGGPGGALAGAAAVGTPMFSASNVARAVEEDGRLTVDAAERSIGAAPVQAAADALVGRFLPGAGRVLGDVASTQAGGFLRRTAVSMAKAGATEAVTEAAQQVGERYAAGLELGSADAAAEYMNAAVTAFAVGGVLGAGGGFRRANTEAKAPENVTVDDINAKVDARLAGTDRSTLGVAGVAPEQQLGLDLQGGVTNEEQMALPLQPEPEVAPMLPSQMPQLPGLFPALSTVPVDTQLELGQRFEDNLTPMDLPGRGVQVSPELEALISQTMPTPQAPLSASTILSRGPIDAVTGTDTQVDVPTEARPFREIDVADLRKAKNAKNADPAVVAAVDAELEARKVDAAAADPFAGVRMNQDIAKLRNAEPADLQAGVLALLEAGDSRVGTFQLAERLGIDVNATGEAAAALSDPVAPAAPAAARSPVIAPSAPAPQQLQSAQSSVDFAPEWSTIMQSAGVSRPGGDLAAPTSLADARARVFTALADDTVARGEATKVERLARSMGLITDDSAMDVTPLGRQAYLGTTAGFEETVSAAQQQGYTGRQASSFDRGVRAQVSGEADPTIADFSDMAAYEAGKVWAQDFIQNGDVRTAAQTQAIMARQEGRTTAREGVAPEMQLSPGQTRQQALNRLISRIDTRGVRDGDVAQLRRMVRDGATEAEVGDAIQRVQRGEALFEESPVTEARPIDRARPTRGQPVFREMYDPSENTPAKQQQRAETEAAVRSYDMRSLIQLALNEKAITQQRADRLNALLDQGKVSQVERSMKSFMEPDAEAQMADLKAPTSGEADVVLEQWIGAQDFDGAISHMVDHAPSAYHKALMTRVRDLARQMQKVGIELTFNVARPGDMVPRALNNPSTRAITTASKNPPSAAVWLKSIDMGPQAGMNYQIAAHEMVHAVTLMLTRYGNRVDAANTKTGKAVQDLYALSNAIVDHFNQRAAAGNLTDFEQRFLRRENNALADVDEILAWGLTNPDMQRYLQSIEYKPRQSVFDRMMQLVRDLLGLDAKYDTALTELLRVSEQIMTPGDADLRAAYSINDVNSGETEPLQAALTDEGTSAANRTVDATSDAGRAIATTLGNAVESLGPQDMLGRARKTMLGWLSRNHMVRSYGEQVPSMVAEREAHRERVAIDSRFKQMGEDAYQSFEALEQSNANAAKWVGQLMATTTEFQLDPTKTWAEHTWHEGAANAAALQRLHGDAVKLMNDLRRGDGAGWQQFEKFRAFNEAQNYARMATNLHNLVAMDPELALGVARATENPADAFMRADISNDANAVRDYWLRSLDRQVADAMSFVTEKKGEAARGTESDQRAMRQHLSPIEMQIGAIMEAKQAMGRAPYFHLGRFGDNFGSATIRKGQDGTVDPVAQRHVAEALEAAGFTDVQISADNTKPRIALRFDKRDDAIRFRDLMLGLQKQGWLDGEPKDITWGPRDQANNFGTADGLPAFVNSYIQSIEASPMFAPDESMSAADKATLAKSKNDMIQLARDTWIEHQPDNAISKVLVKRYTVPGYNKDMIRNWSHRWNVGSTNIANMASTPKFNRAFTDMRGELNAARQGDSTADPFVISDVMNELKTRNARSPIEENADTLDKLRGIAHSFFLGFSPAYGMINMTQLGVVALPELAKKHGYTKSFHAMRRASVDAMKIVRAAGSEALQLNWKRWGDVAITDAVLKNAGLSPDMQKFMTHMMATGAIDIGTMARSLGQVADGRGVGGNLDTYLKLSSSIGLYTETFSRLVTALAARDLNGGYDAAAQKYASDVVSNAMFDYPTWNTARQLGKRGVLGPVTPLLTQFMSYSVQITEKLYSEFRDATSRARPGETAATAKARRAESQRFLAGHLTAVTALAGTMGLPFATVFAAVIEKMLGDDEEPYDATAAWRGFLADVLGKEFGEVVARGLPRAAGFDISQRVGEHNLMPFSEFLSQRGSWKEAIEGTASRSIGAVPSMLVSVLDGGNQIADGDVLGGMKAMVPVAFKSPIEAYRMSTDGYVDTKGNKLPMTPGASAILWQLLGFNPSAKAEYGEARGDQYQRNAALGDRAGKLRQGIVRATLQGDQAKARELVREAIAFDTANPESAVLPSVEGALQRQLHARAQARALGAPLGVRMQDIVGRSLTQYANVDY